MYWTSSASQRNSMAASETKSCCQQWHSIWPKKHSYWTLPEIYVSHQKSFFPRATEAEALQTEYVYIWQWHRWAGQATMDNSRSEGCLPSRHPMSFLGSWLHPLASAQHPFLKEYEKHETYMWVGWWEWIGTDHSQEASTWQAWGKPVRWPIRLATEEDSMWKKIKWTLMGCWWKEINRGLMCILKTPSN